MHRAARSGLLAVLMCVAGAHLATAEPIVLNDGFLEMDPHQGPLQLEGERGFTFSGSVNWTGGYFVPAGECGPCAPGTAVPLRARWIGLDAPGTATLDGVTFDRVGGAADPTVSLGVDFSGVFTAPEMTSDTAIVNAPFTFSGTFLHPGGLERLVGLGTATLWLEADPSAPGAWNLTRARYDLAPVPEPATLLLVGGALAGVAALRRARQRG